MCGVGRNFWGPEGVSRAVCDFGRGSTVLDGTFPGR